MRHSRFTTTAEIYEQDLPESQLRAVEQSERVSELRTQLGQHWDHRKIEGVVSLLECGGQGRNRYPYRR